MRAIGDLLGEVLANTAKLVAERKARGIPASVVFAPTCRGEVSGAEKENKVPVAPSGFPTRGPCLRAGSSLSGKVAGDSQAVRSKSLPDVSAVDTASPAARVVRPKTSAGVKRR